MSRTLLIGVGNSYRSDDGIGLAIARALKAEFAGDEDVAVLEQTGEGSELMEAWRNAEAVMVFDAVSSGAEPGTIFQLDAQEEQIPSEFFNYSTHAFSVAEAIEMARVLDELPPHCVLFGVEGGCFDAGVGLSEPARCGVEDVIAQVKAELNASLTTTRR
jgi:hydrogenase maturation protease